MPLPLILRHDESTTNAPAPDQISVGEIIINSITGKLYTKLVNGTVVEFIGQQVCFTKLPIISFDEINNFCCSGDILKIKVEDLIDLNDYSFEIEDISGNNVSTSLQNPIYTSYASTLSNGNNINLKEAIIPCTIEINGSKNITILKFKVIFENKELTSRILTLSCQNC
jgi:hypothetical protein